MNANHDDATLFDELDGSPPSKEFRIPWWLVLALAVVAFRLTGRSDVSIFIGCFKFGGENFQTAWWMLRRDPIRSRGFAYAWMFISHGLYRVVATTLIIVTAAGFVILFLEAAQGAPNAPPTELFVSVFMTAGIAFFLSLLSSVIAVLIALYAGKRIWISRVFHQSRRRDAWPPVAPTIEPITQGPERNYVDGVLLVAFGVIVPTTWILLPAIVAFIVPNGFVLALMCVGTAVLPFVAIWQADRRIVAKTPAEAWGDEPAVFPAMPSH